MLLNGLDQLQAVAIGQPHVGQTEIESHLAKQALSVCQAGSRSRIDAHAPQRQLQELTNIGFIVDDQR